MLTKLLIRDETTASLGKAEHTFTVHVSGETVSVRELIRQRVYQEVEEFNNRKPAVFRMLVQPTESERTLNGFKFHHPRQIDPETQYEKAIEAFQENGFIILVDDYQAESLETEIPLYPETSVTFLKLVPLVGG
jgi:hypothetical protein